MKPSIPLAFATLAIPFLAMAQSSVTPPSAPAPGEEKPLIPSTPVPAPDTPLAPPVVPPLVPPVPVPPAVPPVIPPGVPAVPPVVPPSPMPVPDVPPVPVPAVPGLPEKPARPGFERPAPPGSKRPGSPGAEEKPGKPRKPGERGKPGDLVPAPDATPPSSAPTKNQNPGTQNPDTPAAPAPGMKAPSAPPAQTTESATPPATPGSRPFPGRRPTDPRGRPFGPPVTPAPVPGTTAPVVAPAPTPGTPMPAVTATPEVPVAAKPAERPVPQKAPSKETAKVLEDVGKRDRQADAAQARKIDSKDDAKRLLMNILGAAVGVETTQDRSNQPRPGDRPGDRTGDRPSDRFRQGYRPPVEEVGRTQEDRQRNVGNMVHRFEGRTPPQPAPQGTLTRDPRNPQFGQGQRAPRFYDGNRRVVRYSSMQEIPPVIVASQQLNRVQVLPQAQSTYNVRPPAPQAGFYHNDIPSSYTAGDAYAVSYSVDPNSAISRDDILFRQGSADFADAYSYDLVIDVAEAMKAPSLRDETFVIEGHASAEGDYGKNLLLSQERAERISRELVRHGVSAERLMPVGYGEAEAAHPATAVESERSLDRRVMVFRMR